MSEFSQTRSFNLGVAEETSIEAALIYDDLVYAQKIFGKGWFYRSYEQMLKRFPMFSESTIRRHVKKLVDGGWVLTKIMKVGGAPVCHFQIDRFLSVNLTESMETVNLTESLRTTKEQLKKKSTHSDSNSSLVDSPPNQRSSALDKVEILLQTLINIVNPREKCTMERERMLNARSKDYSREEIIKAATAFSKSEWHKENKQMSIDNLLAPSKFGRWFTAGVDVQDEISQDERVEQAIKEQAEILERNKRELENGYN